MHNRQPISLEDFGWRTFFSDQITSEEQNNTVPGRVVAVHRNALMVHDGEQEHGVRLGRHWLNSASRDRPTTGDWLLLDSERQWISRLLERETVIKRVSAGVNAGQQAEEQAIAANIDTLFVVTSCNDDFNESRLERYMTVAQTAGIQPVIIVTKSDLAEDPESYRKRVRAISDVPAAIVNALDESSVQEVEVYLVPGQTVAIVGSSGVGKSTLLNTLAGARLQSTGDVRQADQRGRHTTTNRSIHLLGNGALMLDTPGIRELTFAFGQETLSNLFEDIESLILQCRFSNCGHSSEPGCAINDAIENGKLDSRRFGNYLKMLEEEARNTKTIEEQRLDKRRYKYRKLQEQPYDP